VEAFLQQVAKEAKPVYTEGLMAIFKTHNQTIAYILWLFGLFGAHRFYYGRPVTGTLWMCTFGMFGIGWIIDLFLIPSMQRDVDCRYLTGAYDYAAAWLSLVLLGYMGGHRFYLGKWRTGLLYALTLGLCFVGVLYDLWTLNRQLSRSNHRSMTTNTMMHVSVY
jgi:TM2 domain-containing membrane protein YozV